MSNGMPTPGALQYVAIMRRLGPAPVGLDDEGGWLFTEATSPVQPDPLRILLAVVSRRGAVPGRLVRLRAVTRVSAPTWRVHPTRRRPPLTGASPVRGDALDARLCDALR